MYPSTQSREGRCCVDIFPILYGFTFWKDQKATGLTPLEKWIYLYHVASSYGVNVRAWNIHQHQHHTTVHFNCVDLTITFSYSFFFMCLFCCLYRCLCASIALFYYLYLRYSMHANGWGLFFPICIWTCIYVDEWISVVCVCVCVAPVCEYEWVNVCPLFCSFFFARAQQKRAMPFTVKKINFIRLTFIKSGRNRFRVDHAFVHKTLEQKIKWSLARHRLKNKDRKRERER